MASGLEAKLRKRNAMLRGLLREYGCEDSEGIVSAVRRLIQEHKEAVCAAEIASATFEDMKRDMANSRETRDEAQAASTRAVMARRRAEHRLADLMDYMWAARSLGRMMLEFDVNRVRIAASAEAETLRMIVKRGASQVPEVHDAEIRASALESFAMRLEAAILKSSQGD